MPADESVRRDQVEVGHPRKREALKRPIGADEAGHELVGRVAEDRRRSVVLREHAPLGDLNHVEQRDVENAHEGVIEGTDVLDDGSEAGDGF